MPRPAKRLKLDPSLNTKDYATATRSSSSELSELSSLASPKDREGPPGAELGVRNTDSDSDPNQLYKVKNLEAYRFTDMPDAEVYHVPEFIDKETAEEWYTELIGLDTWYQPKLKIMGKEITQSRKIAAYTISPTFTLKYSGQHTTMNRTYPPLLLQIQRQVEARIGVRFNHVMLNLYEDGKVYIGNHRDNPENKVIASLSLGAPRTFVMTHDGVKSKSKKGVKRKAKSSTTETLESAAGRASSPTPAATNTKTKKRWTLQPGSLVVMQGDTQRYWKHEIPKEPKVKEGRISLTFRQIVE